MANNDEKFAYLDQLSTEQLNDLLRADIESPENSDEDVIYHILEVIEQREQKNPTGRLPDVDRAWEEFQQYYNIPEGEGQVLYSKDSIADGSINAAMHKDETTPKTVRVRRILKHGFAAVIAVLILFCGMVVAQAAGLDIFGYLGRWTEETFRFVTDKDNSDSAAQPTSDASTDTDIVTNPEHAAYYQEMQSALSSIGIEDPLAPSWYPDGFEPSAPQIKSNDKGEVVANLFSGEGGRYFHIAYTLHNDSSIIGHYTFEKDDSEVEEYTSAGKTFYILSNMDTITATWSDDLLIMTISGQLTKDEVKSIIDSLGVAPTGNFSQTDEISPEVIKCYYEFQATLAETDITEKLGVTWVPDGFALLECGTMSNDISSTTYQLFSNEGEGRTFSVLVSKYFRGHNASVATYEKDSSLVEQYISNGRTFYIMSNIKTNTAVWANEDIEITVAGQLSASEIKTVIDSMGRL